MMQIDDGWNDLPNFIEDDHGEDDIFSEEPKNNWVGAKKPSVKKNESILSCPVCDKLFYGITEDKLTEHVDECLARGFDSQPQQQQQPAPKCYPPPILQNPTFAPPPPLPGFNSYCNECKVDAGHLTSCSRFHRNQKPNVVQPNPPSWLHSNPNPPPPPPQPQIRNVQYNRVPPPQINNDFTNPQLRVQCCYLGCHGKKLMDPKSFVAHVVQDHATSNNQQYPCPICAKLYGNNYSVNERTNLFEHIQAAHIDLLLSDQGFFSADNAVYQDDDFYYNPDDFQDVAFVMPDSKSVGSSYIDDIAQSQMVGKECSICFDEFLQGAAIARMDCFCVFHKTCINEWLQKSPKCPLHKD